MATIRIAQLYFAAATCLLLLGAISSFQPQVCWSCQLISFDLIPCLFCFLSLTRNQLYEYGENWSFNSSNELTDVVINLLA